MPMAISPTPVRRRQASMTRISTMAARMTSNWVYMPMFRLNSMAWVYIYTAKTTERSTATIWSMYSFSGSSFLLMGLVRYVRISAKAT